MYERCVSAALAETQSRFRLAEALALDIPQRPEGQAATALGRMTVDQELEAARNAIARAGGEPRTVPTLRDYRATALWVKDSDLPIFRWLPDTSFSAHDTARRLGMSYDEFTDMPQRTVDAVRRARAQPREEGSEEDVERSRQLMRQIDFARQVLQDDGAAVMAADALRIRRQRDNIDRLQRRQQRRVGDSQVVRETVGLLSDIAEPETALGQRLAVLAGIENGLADDDQRELVWALCDAAARLNDWADQFKDERLGLPPGTSDPAAFIPGQVEDEEGE